MGENADRTAFRDVLCGQGAIGTEGIIFRAFIAGTMMADKGHSDDSLSARDW